MRVNNRHFFFLENDTAITDGRIQAADRPNTIPWFCYLLFFVMRSGISECLLVLVGLGGMCCITYQKMY